MKPVGRVAVLGGGIMGTCLSLNLARRGFKVTIFEAEDAPLMGASRWNEGKIHLGYLYAADPSLKTAVRVLPGGLSFARLLSDLIEEPVANHATVEDDIYLIHKESVVGVGEAAAYYDAVSEHIRSMPGADAYFCDVTHARSRRLTRKELQQVADIDVISAGFSVPERSVNTVWLADRLCEALNTEPLIDLRLNERVTNVAPAQADDGPWRVHTNEDAGENFDWVINALWHGRLEIDLAAGLEPEPGWCHRYRVSVFARTSKSLQLPNAVAAIGPFGDIKNYNERDFYISWYPAGLLDESEAIAPRLPSMMNAAERRNLIARIQKGFSNVMPAANAVFEAAESLELEGGFVFALGQGSISEPGASLHRRDRFGVRRRGHYVSVDTGKYSSAPLLAKGIVAEIGGS